MSMNYSSSLKTSTIFMQECFGRLESLVDSALVSAKKPDVRPGGEVGVSVEGVSPAVCRGFGLPPCHDPLWRLCLPTSASADGLGQ